MHAAPILPLTRALVIVPLGAGLVMATQELTAAPDDMTVTPANS
jgi:hypothetical protein